MCDFYCEDYKSGCDVLKWVELKIEELQNTKLPSSTILIKQQLNSLDEYHNKKNSKLNDLDKLRLLYNNTKVDKLLPTIDDKLTVLLKMEDAYVNERNNELQRLQGLDAKYKLYEGRFREREDYFQQVKKVLKNNISRGDLDKLSLDFARRQDENGDMLDVCQELLNANYKHGKKMLEKEMQSMMKLMEIRRMIDQKSVFLDELQESKEADEPESLNEDISRRLSAELNELDIVKKSKPTIFKNVYNWLKSEQSAEFKGVVLKLALLIVVWPGIKYVLSKTFQKAQV